MEHHSINTKRGAVHYWTDGDADESIIFTHGATMDHGMLQHQMEHFRKRYKVISWDVPLHGESRPYQGFSLQHAADDLAAILDAEHIERAHLVGQSMGGYICQFAASAYLARVQSITAVGSSPVQLAYYSRLDRWLLSITPSLLMLYPYGYLIRLMSRQISLDATARAYAYQTLRQHTKKSIAEIMAAVYRGVLSAVFGRLACPILITYGESDTSGKVRSYCKRWAKEESRELRVISNAAHNANMDNPQEFNQVLGTWLDQLSA